MYVPVVGEGRDEGAEGDGARVGKEPRDFGDAADVLVAAVLAEPEVAAEATANVVSVEAVAEHALRSTAFIMSVKRVAKELTLATRYSSSAKAIVVLPAPDRPVNHTVQPLKALFLLPRPSA